jgi:hypothetical protein
MTVTSGHLRHRSNQAASALDFGGGASTPSRWRDISVGIIVNALDVLWQRHLVTMGLRDGQNTIVVQSRTRFSRVEKGMCTGLLYPYASPRILPVTQILISVNGYKSFPYPLHGKVNGYPRVKILAFTTH